MKKTIIATSVVCALSFASNAFAGNTLTFLGEITDSTCEVAVEGGNSTVTLPTVGKELLSAVGSTAGRTSFALLASNCVAADGKTKVAAYFNGVGAEGANAGNVDSVTGYLNNLATADGTDYDAAAQNVQLRLIDGTNEKVIKAGYADQSTAAGYVTIDSSNSARMPYAVEYISTSGNATSGPVKGMVVYDLMYQ